MPHLLVGGLMHPHLEALARALDAERDHQRDEHRRLLGLSLEDRVAVGLSWAPLEVTRVELAGRGRVRVVLRAPRGVALHDGIGSGDPVLLAPAGTPDDGLVGLCVGAEGRTAEIRVPGPFDDPRPQAVTRRFDATTFDRYQAGLTRLDAHPSVLRELLLGERPPAALPEPLSDAPELDGLNEGQRHAARTALSSLALALVHGPPGTGKTRLLTALLQALVSRGERPWALADSNAAVDHLAVRAARTGLDVVRLGHPARIGSDAWALSLDARIEGGSLGPALRTMDRDLVKLRADGSRDGRRALRALLDERDRAVAQARDAVLSRCDVVACTLGTLARLAPELGRTTTAVVDEATQALEPGILSVVPWVDRLVLVGDPFQLGPVVKQPGNPLERSLLTRLLDDVAVPFPMLEVQHRMHADIQALVDPVYHGALRAHPHVAGHRLADLPGVAEAPLTSRATLWIDTAGAGFDEVRDPVTSSLYSRGEARIVALVVGQLRDAGVPPDAIGVIAPYSAQVACLSEQPALQGVEVATVNAFQGREKEAVICSFVRSNTDGEVGFVADPRRLTVALTRARRLLVCVGDSATLSGAARFTEVLEQLQREDAWETVFAPPWDSALE